MWQPHAEREEYGWCVWTHQIKLIPPPASRLAGGRTFTNARKRSVFLDVLDRRIRINRHAARRTDDPTTASLQRAGHAVNLLRGGHLLDLDLGRIQKRRKTVARLRGQVF